jgi:hypothetical protein
MSGVEKLAPRAQRGLRTFAIYRDEDVSGVSGTGIVVEGVLFSTGVVVIHWLTPPPRGSLNIFDSWEQFMAIHVGAHPENRSEIHWGDGGVWGPGEWRSNPSPWTEG